MQSFKKHVLDNGLRIILVPQPQSLAVTLLVLVEAGSKYEAKEINGISHFLEHMYFKGTAVRPRAFDISSELDQIGAEYNAFTGHELTGYFAKARLQHFDQILDVISDIYLNSVFNPAEIEKEKGVIIEEINMYEDIPPRRVHDYFMRLLYGDQPAGWEVAGRKEVVKKLTREDFLNYHGKHYLADSTVVVLAGAFDEEDAIAKIEKSFRAISAGKKFGKLKIKEEQKKPEIYLKAKESDQTHLVIGCRSFDIFDDRRYALDVLSDILGGGMSSRLFQKIREELGAAYYIKSDAEFFTDHGYLAVSAGADNQKSAVVIKAILEELKKSSLELVDEKELRRAKDHLIGHLILGLETSDALAMFYGGQEIIEKSILTPTDLIWKIEAVKSEDILKTADYIFKNQKLNLALIGPFEDEKEFESALRF